MKEGKLDDVSHFRGITLLSTLGKIFTRILNNRLTDWAEKRRQDSEVTRIQLTTHFSFMESLIMYLIKEKNFSVPS